METGPRIVFITGAGGDEVFSSGGVSDDGDDVFTGNSLSGNSFSDGDVFTGNDESDGGDDVFSGNDEHDAVSGTDETIVLLTDNDGESSRIDGDDDVSLSSNSETTPRTELPTAFRHRICNWSRSFSHCAS